MGMRIINGVLCGWLKEAGDEMVGLRLGYYWCNCQDCMVYQENRNIT